MNETPSDSEEEILIYAEFEDSVNIENYRSIHVLGINEGNPIIQMDDTFFTGEFKNPLGTYMFFDEDPSPHCSDPLFDKLPERSLKYLFKTRKLLRMQHAYVTPKEGPLSEQNLKSAAQQRDDDIDMVTFKSAQEALEKFNTEFNKNTKGPVDSKNSIADIPQSS